MSFECPERKLTKEEWQIISEAALDSGRELNRQAAQYYRLASETEDEQRKKDYHKLMNFTAKKAQKIFQILIDIEDEYYKQHPDEDPDRKEKDVRVL